MARITTDETEHLVATVYAACDAVTNPGQRAALLKERSRIILDAADVQSAMNAVLAILAEYRQSHPGEFPKQTAKPAPIVKEKPGLLPSNDAGLQAPQFQQAQQTEDRLLRSFAEAHGVTAARALMTSNFAQGF